MVGASASTEPGSAEGPIDVANQVVIFVIERRSNLECDGEFGSESTTSHTKIILQDVLV